MYREQINVVYAPPQTTVIKLNPLSPILFTSPQGGDGVIPPTDNDNNDNDW